MIHTKYGTSVSATSTIDFSDDKMVSAIKFNGPWKTDKDVTVELSGDVTMRDFMFTLEEIKFSGVPVMAQDAVKRVSERYAKMDTEFVNTSIIINAPDKLTENGLELRYNISVEPKNGGSSFSCLYAVDGTFIEIID